jgi:hypothetical protein
VVVAVERLGQQYIELEMTARQAEVALPRAAHILEEMEFQDKEIEEEALQAHFQLQITPAEVAVEKTA